MRIPHLLSVLGLAFILSFGVTGCHSNPPGASAPNASQEPAAVSSQTQSNAPASPAVSQDSSTPNEAERWGHPNASGQAAADHGKNTSNPATMNN